MREQDSSRKIIIIGAGPAGITCALEVLRRNPDIEVEVLEASSDIGGISKTIVSDGGRMDIGGHRFFTKDERVLECWQSLLPLQGAPAYDDKVLRRNMDFAEGGPDPESSDRVMLLRNRVSRIFYDGQFYDYPISLSWATLGKLGIGRVMSVGFSYIAAKIHPRKEDSLENFYINRFGKKLYSMFFEGYTEKLWGRHPSEIAADWGSQRVKGLSITKMLQSMFAKAFGKKETNIETSLIEQFYYPKFGPGQLWETAAKEVEYRGGTVKMECKVDGIRVENGRTTGVSYHDADGCEHFEACSEVVSTMPLPELIASIGNQVPQAVSEIAAKLPFRDFVTVGMLVDKLAISNTSGIPTLSNIVPDNWIYVQDDSVKLGRIQIFNNWSPYLVPDVENTVWVGLEYFCAEGDDFWMMDADECVELAKRELEKIGVIDGTCEILFSHREKIKKAYPAYFGSYSEIDTVRTWLKKIPNLYCIGRNGQHRYNNMDHSMLTAMFAADAICEGNKTQDDIWNVNTEDEYQEEAGQ